jgi:hypothetical protein
MAIPNRGHVPHHDIEVAQHFRPCCQLVMRALAYRRWLIGYSASLLPRLKRVTVKWPFGHSVVLRYSSFISYNAFNSS